MTLPKPTILDISEWQLPSQINYDVLSKQISGVVVRVQYGSNYKDKHYQTHIKEFQKRNVPVAVYAWVRGSSIQDMEVEATDFYNRAKEFNPVFWWLDVEEQSMSDMRNGSEAYRKKLKQLGAKKVGAYIGNHLYKQFNLDVSKFDAIWLPTYGSNNGQYNGSNPTATSKYDMHQYTDKGRLPGYTGNLDLNRIVSDKFNLLFGQSVTEKPKEPSNPTKPTENKGGKIKMKSIKLTSEVYLRTKADKKSKEIDLLKKGATVEFDDIIVSQGYMWGVQPRSDGSKGYIALGEFNGYGSIA